MWNLFLPLDPRNLTRGALHFGGGPDPVAPPAPAPTPAAPAPDTAGAKAKVSGQQRRRVGGMDAVSGNVLGSLSDAGRTRALGGNATAYSGEQ